MELSKKKYAKKEVLAMLSAYGGEYEKRLVAQRERIDELVKENRELRDNLVALDAKQTLISDTLLRAEQTASDIKKQTENEYYLELARLKDFSKRWDKYFSALKEKYPMYDKISSAVKIKETLDSNCEKEDPKSIIKKLDNMLDSVNEEAFDPKSKIKDYIAATGDNGFNLDEVLNPGKLELEDLCKELGLIDSKE